MISITTISRPALLVCLLTLTACATNTEPSGFLTSYDGFKAGPKGGVDRYWTPPNVKSEADFKASIRKYNKLLIDPIWLSMKDKGTFDGVEPKKLNNLVDLFHKEMIAAIGSRYTIVSQPGPGVLRLSLALTGVESPNRLLAATSTFSPVGLGLSTVKKLTTGEHANVGSASMEALVTDSQTGATLFAAIDRH
ncbi:MAG: DUF3313 family protein [Alphaproteobacteria bacterium]|nr:DUF3313 family protein [Alphaproteobacteria bacterium]